MAEQERGARGKRQRVFELNFEPEYWTKRFLFPYALDLAPMKLPPPDQMDTFNFDKGTTASGPVLAVGPKTST